MQLLQRNITPNIVSSTAFVRPQATRRLSRVRVAWFIVGSACGALLTYAAISFFHNDPEYSKRLQNNRSIALLDANITVLPAPVAVVSPQIAAVAPLPTADKSQKTMVLPAKLSLSVQRGDTLMSMLTDNGVAQDEAYQVVQSMSKVYNPKRLSIGQSLELNVDKSKEGNNKLSVSGLAIPVSPLTTIALARNDNNAFSAREIKSPVYKSIVHAGGAIHSSLYQTGIEAGVPPQMLSEVINALSYDIDFQRDIKNGDSLDVVYERIHTAKNATTGYGNVLYVSLGLGDRDLTFYRHMTPDGFAGYYNAKGESVKKALLRTPINGAHITSSFGMRMHPLLGYSKMHKGIDFGALMGTPIYAAGDGVIEEAGIKGGYGNYVRIKHSGTYSTAYGHASRIASGIRPGVHVKQGQVIAYVGSTGRSTGPHLHYEILVNNQQVNPAGVKFRTGQTLLGHELALFNQEKQQVVAALATAPRSTQLASLGSHSN